MDIPAIIIIIGIATARLNGVPAASSPGISLKASRIIVSLTMSWLLVIGILSVIAVTTPRAAAGTIAVTNPSQGSIWQKGSTYTIQWTSSGSGPDVKIEYDYWFYSSPTEINSRTANDGSYSWTVPSGMTSRTDYFIRIWDADDPLTYDDSDQFEITSQSSASITITSPGYTAVWYTGNTYTIAWTNTGTIANVKISYDCLVCSTNGDIIASTPNTGSYSWNVPSSLPTDTYYTLRVSDASNTATYDETIPFLIRPGSNMMLIIGAVAGIAILLIVIVVVVVILSKRKKAAVGPQQANIPVVPPQTGWQQQPQQHWQHAQAQPPMQTYQPQPYPQAAATKLCKNCGRPIPNESVFCTFCGGRN